MQHPERTSRSPHPSPVRGEVLAPEAHVARPVARPPAVVIHERAYEEWAPYAVCREPVEDYARFPGAPAMSWRARLVFLAFHAAWIFPVGRMEGGDWGFLVITWVIFALLTIGVTDGD